MQKKTLKRLLRIFVLLIFSSALLTACGGGSSDKLQFTNISGNETGILVDGLKGGVDVNDEVFTGLSGGEISVGAFSSSAQSNEIIAYTNNRPPTLDEAIAWTTGTDTFTVDYESKYLVPFYVWIVKGPFPDQQTRAINACVKTAQIWTDERQGIGFNIFSIQDATGDSDASTYYNFTCPLANSMKTDIGFNANGINIYYVDTVDFGSGPGTTNGVWCGGNLVVMGRNTSDHLFSHEIGHGFALGHVQSITSFFDTSNVMHNASNNRNYLTEGQTFRAVVDPDSSINQVYNKRPGLTTRNCSNSTDTTNFICPAIQKRIWSDGASWPPN